MPMPEQPNDVFLFLTDVLGRRLEDQKGNSLGRVHDVKILLVDSFPKVTALCVKKGWGKGLKSLDWERVEPAIQSVLKVKDSGEGTSELEVKDKEILLREEILDKQVVDTVGAKIERVNDIHLLSTNGELRVVHVDVGIRGLLRRLGWEKWFDSLTQWLFSYKIPHRLISWKYVQPLADDPMRKTLKLSLSQQRISEIHPSDLADILEDLGHHKRQAIFGSLDPETAAEALEEVVPQMQHTLVEGLQKEKLADIIEEMAPDEAVDLLSKLSEDKKVKIMEEIAREKREILENLLLHPEGKAGSIMTTEFVSLNQNLTVAAALNKIKTEYTDLEVIYYVYVVDDQGHLLGVLSLRNLLVAEPEMTLEQLMKRTVKKVKVGESKKKVINIFRKYDFVVVPVVDKENTLKGIITLKDAINSAIPEFRPKR